ncbi:MAG: hypothetical protein QOD06_2631 [Candidatus Binatota bacterium]|nr:hypothetical protein [Candidatus Binatota bacterium]
MNRMILTLVFAVCVTAGGVTSLGPPPAFAYGDWGDDGGDDEGWFVGDDYDEDDSFRDEDADYFYDDLAPYGEWTRFAPYGRVWRPTAVGSQWQPYTQGHWVYTEYGWTWVADEPWGWAPYHYGRWFNDPRIGWAWVPRRQWAPAWVSWRRGDGWVGWAPLPPDARWRRSGGLYRGYRVPSRHYCFVPDRRFASPSLGRYVVSRDRAAPLIRQTRNVTNYTVTRNRIVNRSIDIREIRKVSGPVNEVHVREIERARPRVRARARRETMEPAPGPAGHEVGPRQHGRSDQRPGERSSFAPSGGGTRPPDEGEHRVHGSDRHDRILREHGSAALRERPSEMPAVDRGFAHERPKRRDDAPHAVGTTSGRAAEDEPAHEHRRNQRSEERRLERRERSADREIPSTRPSVQSPKAHGGSTAPLGSGQSVDATDRHLQHGREVPAARQQLRQERREERRQQRGQSPTGH